MPSLIPLHRLQHHCPAIESRCLDRRGKPLLYSDPNLGWHTWLSGHLMKLIEGASLRYTLWDLIIAQGANFPVYIKAVHVCGSCIGEATVSWHSYCRLAEKWNRICGERNIFTSNIEKYRTIHTPQAYQISWILWSWIKKPFLVHIIVIYQECQRHTWAGTYFCLSCEVWR